MTKYLTTGLWNPEVQFRILEGSTLIVTLNRKKKNQIPGIGTYFFKIFNNIVVSYTPRTS